ncbi:aspartate/glutamate racemase family protein [Cupriavidus sp. H18C2]|uniref:aspartate/glutamate racemase family protein n=1 Tax=Cupriavidus sp. H18C2 TaxID=3241602 RepID=UPI003BF8B152
MKKIGLIGGIGPESTVSYYRQLVEGLKDKMGPEVLPRLSIETLSAFEVFKMCKEMRYDDLTAYVLDAIHCLAAAGADYAALTGNTPNIVFDDLKAKSPIPLVSAIEATLATAQRRNLKTVGLLGTVFTMSNSFFRTPFEKAGIEIVCPNGEQMSYIQDRIEAELEHGVVTDDAREGFVQIIRSMHEQQGIQQVILGCTELPLLLSDENCPVPCLDTVDIHVATLIDLMTEG